MGFDLECPDEMMFDFECAKAKQCDDKPPIFVIRDEGQGRGGTEQGTPVSIRGRSRMSLYRNRVEDDSNPLII